MADLTHFDRDGNARMVDVGRKPETQRVAVACAVVWMKPETLELMLGHQIGKGDVLAVARLAGIMATKRTSDLIPLCHPIRIDSVDIEFETPDSVEDEAKVEIRATVMATDRTGVEMEALTAVSVAALTIYDMCKSVDRAMQISDIQLDSKTGGKSGDYSRQKP